MSERARSLVPYSRSLAARQANGDGQQNYLCFSVSLSILCNATTRCRGFRLEMVPVELFHGGLTCDFTLTGLNSVETTCQHPQSDHRSGQEGPLSLDTLVILVQGSRCE